jgi:hypothetical protein
MLVVEGLRRALADAKRQGDFKGISISPALQITHLHFVDDVIIYAMVA